MANTDIAVASLTVTGGLKMLTAEWTWTAATSPLPYLQLDHFEVWVSTINDRALATKVADAKDLSYSLTGLGYSATRYFWVRAIDLSGNVGDFYPLSATGGIGSATLSLLAAADIADNSLTGSKLVVNAITARELILADYRNLVPNGGWDDPINNYWSFTASGGSAPQFQIVASNLAQTGSRIGRIDKGTAGLGSQCYITSIDPIPVVKGTTYYFETAVRGITGTNQAAGFIWRAYWYQEDGVTPSATPLSNINGDVPLTQTYAVWSNQLVVPADASYCRIRIYHNSTGSTLRWLAIGYVIMRKADGGNLIVQGGIKAGYLDVGSIDSSAYFLNGVAITSVLANSAVTDKVADLSIPPSIVPTTTDQILGSINVASQGYPMAVGSYVDFTTAVGALVRDYTFSLYVTISGTLILIDQVVATSVGASTTRRLSLGGVIMPSGAGPYNVTMRIKSNNASTTVTINDATLVATVTKK